MVKIHADWCGACQALSPKLQQAEQRLQEENLIPEHVRFVRLDRTNEATLAESSVKAEELGLTDIMQTHTKTGEVLVVKGENKSVFAKLTAADTVDTIVGKIREKLANPHPDRH